MHYGLCGNGEFVVPKNTHHPSHRRGTEIPRGEAEVRRGQILSHNSIEQQHFLTEIFFPQGETNHVGKGREFWRVEMGGGGI